MGIKGFLIEAGRLVIYAIYPVYILYINFVFLGVLVLGDTVFDKWVVLLIFIVFNILVTFCMLYYVLVSVTESKSTRDIFPVASEQVSERDYSNINPFIRDSLLERSISRNLCKYCETYKPPRANHCKRCNRCYLRFDHHSYLIDACIGYHNQKFFILFLIFNLITIIYYLALVNLEFGFVQKFETSIIVNIVIANVMSAFILCVNSYSLFSSLRNLLNNETAQEKKALDNYIEGENYNKETFQEGPIVEQSKSKDRKILNPYNLGRGENFKEIFGNTFFEWISPSFTSLCDGISFKKNNNNSTEEVI